MTRAIVVAACLAMGLFAARDARSVWLNAEGYGQALIYPYYTTRAASGNPFNTYITVVNHDSQAKAVRLRFREGRMGKQVASFNLFLSANDAWAGAVVPTQLGAKVLTTDTSCTSPSLYQLGGPGPAPPPGSQVGELEFSDAAYSGTNADGGGEGPDRAREGYVELIEMAILSGAAADAVTHVGGGAPADCISVQSPTFAPLVGPPRGRLSGTGTLINVASGMDFTFNAEALDGLANAPFYRPPNDPYPDFDAAEVVPVSDLTWEGRHYHFIWSRPVDAVSSVLMRWELFNEIIRDPNTQSATDWVLTFPTRRFYVTGPTAAPPFSPSCEDLSITGANREELRVRTQPRVCFAASVIAMRDDSSSLVPVLGSFNGAEGQAPIGSSQIVSGWASMGFVGPGPGAGLKSLPATTVRDMRTELPVASGERVVRGLPVTGLMVRSFLNGTLTCASVACQGNYGGSFVHRYRRFINTPSP